jgi:hypothetical protein
MTQKARQSHSDSKTAILPVVLFGVDQHGKPKAARFPENQARLAAKAAKQLDLRVLTVASPAVAELAATLPVGRVHASGKGFVPYVRGDIYAKLLAAAGAPAPVTQSSTLTLRGAQSNGGGSNTKKPTQDPLPRDWDAIAPGHLVVAQDGPQDGWYEAIVVEQNGDMFTLRWRDYPRERRFARHRRSLGLLCPDPLVHSEAPRSTRPEQRSKPSSGKTAAAKAKPSAQGFPLTWEDIDVDHLVLAKDDGPWRSWWEAIPTEKLDDTFTLRWRDFAQLPTIERARLSLALLYPNPK